MHLKCAIIACELTQECKLSFADLAQLEPAISRAALGASLESSSKNLASTRLSLVP